MQKLERRLRGLKQIGAVWHRYEGIDQLLLGWRVPRERCDLVVQSLSGILVVPESLEVEVDIRPELNELLRQVARQLELHLANAS
eukprot:296912-Pyramimonas_sp.AAC.1